MVQVACNVSSEQHRISFRWSSGPFPYNPYHLEGESFSKFQALLQQAREQLRQLVVDCHKNSPGIPESAYSLAALGHRLYQQLFDPGAEQMAIASEVRNWLEGLRDDNAVQCLEMVVEDSPWSIPWNIIYDEPPDQDTFTATQPGQDPWRPFWGLRYNLACARNASPLRRKPIWKSPNIIIVLDPDIKDGLPERERIRLDAFAARHAISPVSSRAALAQALQQAYASEQPIMIYWLSHATPDALFLGGDTISPGLLKETLRCDNPAQPYRIYKLGGLVFLNACQTAEMGAAGSFFGVLHDAGCSGMVGTEQQVIDTFAARFGTDFLEAFLAGEPVGTILRRLRRSVPLGLLYGTYCPPELRVVQSGKVTSENVRIPPTDVAGGSMLGPDPVLEESEQRQPIVEDTTETGESHAEEFEHRQLPEKPYLGLAPYDREHRALFTGRDDDIDRFSALLDDSTCLIAQDVDPGALLADET